MKTPTAELKKVIWVFYGFQFFFSLLLWLPIFYEYQKQIGLDDTQIFAIQSLYYLAFCLLEIPTGMIADWFGHRRCMIAGAAALIVSNLLPILLPNYDGFLWHFMLIAVSRSLISGASSAYIYEYLRRNDAVPYYKEVEGKARAYSLFGKVICWAAVGWLMQWQFESPYWLTAIAAFISLLLAVGLPAFTETFVQNEIPLTARLANAGKTVAGSPLLIFLIVQGTAIFILARICQVNLFQPILQSKDFQLPSFGIVMSAMTLFEGIGSLKASWLKRFGTDINAVYGLTFVMAISLMLLPYAGWIMALFWLCLFSMAAGFAYPIQRQLMNDAIPDSRSRATILSIESIVDRAGNAGLAALIGGFLAAGRLNDFLQMSGAVTIAGIILLFFLAWFFKLHREMER